MSYTPLGSTVSLKSLESERSEKRSVLLYRCRGECKINLSKKNMICYVILNVRLSIIILGIQLIMWTR